MGKIVKVLVNVQTRIANKPAFKGEVVEVDVDVFDPRHAINRGILTLVKEPDKKPESKESKKKEKGDKTPVNNTKDKPAPKEDEETFDDLSEEE